MTQNPRQKKLIRDKYLKKAEKKGHWEPSTVIWLLFLSKSSCSKQCSKYFPEEVRSQINKYYWNISSNEMQMQWMLQMIKTCTLSHPRKYISGKKERLPESSSLRERGRQKIQYVKPQTISIYWFYLLHNYVDTSTK